MIKLRRALIILMAFTLILCTIAYLINQRQPSAPKKPGPSEPQPTPGKSEEAVWYIQFTVKGQKITAYTETSYARLAASGRDYFSGGIAVHPLYPGVDPRRPVIPFGTRVYLNEPVTIHGVEYDSFTVMDTGDIFYGLWSQHPYWFDIYYGTADYWNNKGARDFGVKSRDYYWIEKWH